MIGILEEWIWSVRILVVRILTEGIVLAGACLSKGGVAGRWRRIAGRIGGGLVVNVRATNGAGDLPLIYHPTDIGTCMEGGRAWYNLASDKAF